MNDKQLQEYIEKFTDTLLGGKYYDPFPTEILDELLHRVQDNDSSTLQALKYFCSHLTNEEFTKIQWVTTSLMANSVEFNTRLQVAAFSYEIYFRYRLKRLIQSLTKYDSEQPLFRANSTLLTQSYKREMLSSKTFQLEHLCEVIRFSNGTYANIDEMISPNILENLYNRDIEFFIRINPFFVYDEQPPMMLKREVWRPPSPKWANAIGIKPNQNEGFIYYIPDDIDINSNSYEFIDRNIYNILRLEGYYQRDKNGYFSMVIEELQEQKHPFTNERYIIGRMIHLDSLCDGTDGMKSKLSHIDLAVNLYIEENADLRFNAKVDDSKKSVVPSYRSHFLRINNTILSDIILLSTFFKSNYLQNEWIEGMFSC